jgi:hypothetical protein
MTNELNANIRHSDRQHAIPGCDHPCGHDASAFDHVRFFVQRAGGADVARDGE